MKRRQFVFGIPGGAIIIGFVAVILALGCSSSDAATPIIKPTLGDMNSNPIYLTKKGQDYLGDGQYQKAIEEFDKAIQLNPDVWFQYEQRGYAYYFLAQHQNALDLRPVPTLPADHLPPA